MAKDWLKHFTPLPRCALTAQDGNGQRCALRFASLISDSSAVTNYRRLADFTLFAAFQDSFVGGRFLCSFPLVSLGRVFRENISNE